MTTLSGFISARQVNRVKAAVFNLKLAFKIIEKLLHFEMGYRYNQKSEKGVSPQSLF